MQEEYFVYVIHSASQNIYYKGVSINPHLRLIQHNNNESEYTSHKGPWSLMAIFPFPNKSDALIFEKKIKKFNSSRLIAKINSPLNTLFNN